MDAIHERIRAELKRQKLSTRDAAERLGVSRSQVSKLTRGTADMDMPTLRALCELSGRSADWFVFGREAEPGLSEDERFLVRLYRDIGLDRSEAVRRLTGAALRNSRKVQPGDPVPVHRDQDDSEARPKRRGSA